jgi:hypothetical protein
MSGITLFHPGNPEGKGANGFLLDLQKSRPTGVVAKSRPQLLAEMFTSMLVLSAAFKYRPVVGTANYLYWENDEWTLSLVAPEEWSAAKRGAFAGTCVLRHDMTWTIAPSTLLAEDNLVADAMRRFHAAFIDKLDTDLSLEEILPFYMGKLPYYQRLYASALSRSVYASVVLGEQMATSCRDWRALASPQ